MISGYPTSCETEVSSLSNLEVSEVSFVLEDMGLIGLRLETRSWAHMANKKGGISTQKG